MSVIYSTVFSQNSTVLAATVTTTVVKLQYCDESDTNHAVRTTVKFVTR